MNKQKILYDLLIKLFSSTQDLRTFIYMNVREIHTSIVGENASISNLIFSIVETMSRRGLINNQFFDCLKFQFPQNIEDIKNCEKIIL